ncbi:sugar transferase [PVC group bacterium]|nr:sugar transferase [PVC group bacterium]
MCLTLKNNPIVLKRLLDVVLSVFFLFVLSPVLFFVALLVRINLGKPVLFIQTRPGLSGKLFTLYKIRTMKCGDCSDENRMTTLGRFLRKTSLDELPQLWNVLRGDMSIVGPRPLLPEYLPLYSERQAKRHNVRPGITGWSQVNGRNARSWEDRLEMDVWYVENQSFVLDCRIIIKTVGKVFAGSGVSADGQATVEPFKGSPRK